MFAVDNILVSDELVDAPFACHLGACLGGCCVQGEAGAPLEPAERGVLERLLPVVRDELRPEALRVIEARGVWEETSPGHYTTTCVEAGESVAECVFVTYESGVAKCAIQKAYREGRVGFEKPISCHLYPVRVQSYGDFEALNYEQIELCDPARAHGCRTGMQLVDFLRPPLVRKYGADWYEKFLAACAERRAHLSARARAEAHRAAVR